MINLAEYLTEGILDIDASVKASKLKPAQIEKLLFMTEPSRKEIICRDPQFDSNEYGPVMKARSFTLNKDPKAKVGFEAEGDISVRAKLTNVLSLKSGNRIEFMGAKVNACPPSECESIWIAKGKVLDMTQLKTKKMYAELAVIGMPTFTGNDESLEVRNCKMSNCKNLATGKFKEVIIRDAKSTMDDFPITLNTKELHFSQGFQPESEGFILPETETLQLTLAGKVYPSYKWVENCPKLKTIILIPDEPYDEGLLPVCPNVEYDIRPNNKSRNFYTEWAEKNGLKYKIS